MTTVHEVPALSDADRTPRSLSLGDLKARTDRVVRHAALIRAAWGTTLPPSPGHPVAAPPAIVGPFGPSDLWANRPRPAATTDDVSDVTAWPNVQRGRTTPTVPSGRPAVLHAETVHPWHLTPLHDGAPVLTMERRHHEEGVAWCRTCSGIGSTARTVRHAATCTDRTAVTACTIPAALDGPRATDRRARARTVPSGSSSVMARGDLAHGGIGSTARADVTPALTARERAAARTTARRADGGRVRSGRASVRARCSTCGRFVRMVSVARSVPAPGSWPVPCLYDEARFDGPRWQTVAAPGCGHAGVPTVVHDAGRTVTAGGKRAAVTVTRRNRGRAAILAAQGKAPAAAGKPRVRVQRGL